MPNLTQIEQVEQQIYLIRGKKVMLDSDLAQLYRVETKALNQAVKRNIKRFPEDFMFQLTPGEGMRYQFGTASRDSMRSQSVTASKRNVRFQPYVFTEQGVAMLSSVLKSETAIEVNIQIMRAFIKLRELWVGNKELREKIEQMEKKYDSKFNEVFKAIYQLIKLNEDNPKPKIGFDTK